jgi:hypothetical protein
MSKPLLLLTLACALSLSLLAAGIDGKWTAQVPGREGELREQIYNFKTDGEKLTGTVTMGDAEMPIADGKIASGTITFTITRDFGGNPMKWTYTGKISGDEIQFKREGSRGQPREFVAKRAK